MAALCAVRRWTAQELGQWNIKSETVPFDSERAKVGKRGIWKLLYERRSRREARRPLAAGAIRSSWPRYGRTGARRQELGQWDIKSKAAGLDPDEMVT
jgi:hypothetical protein